MDNNNMDNNNKGRHNMKLTTKLKSNFASLICGMGIILSSHSTQAANVVFSFSTTNGSGMDLFSTAGGTLFNNTTNQGYFALGYVSASYDFTGKSLSTVLNDFTLIAQTSSSWSGVGSSTPASTGGKINNWATSQIDTTSYVGSQLLAVVGVGTTFSKTDTQIAVLRSSAGTGLSAWTVAAPDLSPTPVTMSLNVKDFNQIIFGTYTANAGIISAGPSTFDTIAVVPEPSTSVLITVGAATLVAMRRMRRA